MKYVAITVEWSKKEHKNLCMAYKRYMHRSFFFFPFKLLYSIHFSDMYSFIPAQSLYAPSVGVRTKGILNIIVCYFFYKWKIEGQNVSFVMFMLVICWFFYFSIPGASSIFYLELRREQNREFPVSIGSKKITIIFLSGFLFSLRQGCYLNICLRNLMDFYWILAQIEF
jgi:hypothetical protein